jgi:hypothetical protein
LNCCIVSEAKRLLGAPAIQAWGFLLLETKSDGKPTPKCINFVGWVEVMRPNIFIFVGLLYEKATPGASQ